MSVGLGSAGTEVDCNAIRAQDPMKAVCSGLLKPPLTNWNMQSVMISDSFVSTKSCTT